MRKKISIEGMSCSHCVNHVTNALSEIDGVKNVNVNLEDKYAMVDTENNDLDDSTGKNKLIDYINLVENTQ